MNNTEMKMGLPPSTQQLQKLALDNPYPLPPTQPPTEQHVYKFGPAILVFTAYVNDKHGHWHVSMSVAGGSKAHELTPEVSKDVEELLLALLDGVGVMESTRFHKSLAYQVIRDMTPAEHTHAFGRLGS